MVVNLADYGMNPQAALDAPRWRFMEGSTVLLESTVAQNVVEELAKRRHHVRQTPEGFFGRGQIICKQNQVLIAASEPRADGMAIAY